MEKVENILVNNMKAHIFESLSNNIPIEKRQKLVDRIFSEICDHYP